MSMPRLPSAVRTLSRLSRRSAGSITCRARASHRTTALRDRRSCVTIERHVWHDSQGRLPRCRPRHPVSSGDQGAAERDARRSSTSRSFSTVSRKPSQSGVDNIVIVTGRGKNAIEDHFDVAVELESFLEQRGKTEQLEEIRKITQ